MQWDRSSSLTDRRVGERRGEEERGTVRGKRDRDEKEGSKWERRREEEKGRKRRENTTNDGRIRGGRAQVGEGEIDGTSGAGQQMRGQVQRTRRLR
jgi:hypothetical protein